MNSEERDFKLLRFLMGCITAIIICLIFATQNYYVTKTTEAIKAGLEQRSLKGVNGVYWVNPHHND